jgi:hypothetical protein
MVSTSKRETRPEPAQPERPVSWTASQLHIVTAENGLVDMELGNHISGGLGVAVLIRSLRPESKTGEERRIRFVIDQPHVINGADELRRLAKALTSAADELDSTAWIEQTLRQRSA